MTRHGQIAGALIRAFLGVCGTLGALFAGIPVAAAPDAVLPRAPEHVLIWSQSPGQAERVFGELGFNVRPGQTYPEGIASSTVVFSDWTYLELLHFPVPPDLATPRLRDEFAFVSDGPGANSFAVEVADIDAAATGLRTAGFDVGGVEPDMVDPDGPAGPRPLQPAQWRDFHLQPSPVVGAELFFIAYPSETPPAATSVSAAPAPARATHSNGALRLSAIWILVADLDAEARVYRRLGFRVSQSFVVPGLKATARRASLGGGSVILVAAPKLPAGFRPPIRQGPRILGLSIEAASRPLPGTLPPRYRKGAMLIGGGPLPTALLLQTTAELGFFIAVHAPGQRP
jgi:hypothetical protein